MSAEGEVPAASPAVGDAVPEEAAPSLGPIVQVPRSAIHFLPTRHIDQEKVTALVESIKVIGLLHPITLDQDNNIRAGCHRFLAMERLGWEEVPSRYLASALDRPGQLRQELATIDENLIRNEGTTLERSESLNRRKAIYLELHPETKQGGAPGKAGGGKETKPATVATFAGDTAKKAGISDRTVRRHVQVAESLDPVAKETIRQTPIADSITDLEQLARLPAEKQREVAGRAAKTGETVKRATKELRRAAQIEQVKAYVPPKGQYRVIIRDPSWPYRDKLDGSDAARGGLPYPAATLEEICGQKPPAAADCVLFLWVTNQHLIDLEAPVQRVLRAWDFDPRALITWKKDRMGLGRYVRNITEHCVIAIRGKPVLHLPRDTSWLEVQAPRGKHSEKPEKFYGLVERLCPARPIYEGEARPRAKARKGWVRTGAELPAERQRQEIETTLKDMKARREVAPRLSPTLDRTPRERTAKREMIALRDLDKETKTAPRLSDGRPRDTPSPPTKKKIRRSPRKPKMKLARQVAAVLRQRRKSRRT